MSNKLIGILALAGVVALAGIVTIITVLSTLNRETDLRTAIEAKQVDNRNEMDGMWKIIRESAAVTDKQKDALVEIFQGYAEGRNGSGDHNTPLMNWIKEAVPVVDQSTFKNLQNIVVGKRDGFVMRQKELLDLSRARNQMIERPVSGMILSTFGKARKINIVIVTSDRTEDAFKSGRDNELNIK